MFTYMLDFILKPGGKLEQDNASLLKSTVKEIGRVSTPAENCVGNLSVSKGLDQVKRTSGNHTHQ